jgi:hypothetical protein
VTGRWLSNNTKAQWGLQSYGEDPLELVFDAGLSYREMDDALIKGFKSTLAFHMDGWASANGPITRTWLYRALEILGR